MSRADDLLQKSKQRGLGLSKDRLSSSEVEEILTELTSEHPNGPLYTYIQALGEGAGPELADKVEPFLHSKDNTLAYVALQVLCTDWDLTSHYVDDLVAFIRGVDWDIGVPDFPDRDVQGLAIRLGGRYVHQVKDIRVLDALFSAYEDAKYRAKDFDMQVALQGLALATGFRRLHEMPHLSDEKPWDPALCEDILSRALALKESLAHGGRGATPGRRVSG